MKHSRMLIFFLCLILCVVCSPSRSPAASPEEEDSIVEYVELDDDNREIPVDPPPETIPEQVSPDSDAASDFPAREAFIQDIIDLGEKLFVQANGKLQRAHYSGDIYVCKNFTVYLFRQNREKYRIAAYPDTELRIPNNLPAKKCKPYAYGYCWEEIPPEDGNPFEIAAQFLYDKTLSMEENRTRALDFMRQVKRGDYFQMTARYSHGVGAHSAIMIADYNPETDTVRWMDSNMAGKRINGIRYGKVQFNAEKEISWWVDAFCQKTRGATLYRLRKDIIFADE